MTYPTAESTPAEIIERQAAEIDRLRAALESLDFLPEDYERWPWMVRRRVTAARGVLNADSTTSGELDDGSTVAVEDGGQLTSDAGSEDCVCGLGANISRGVHVRGCRYGDPVRNRDSHGGEHA